MPKLIIAKSIEINATPEKVYSVISDFSQWTAWSPWLIMEPEAKVSVSEGNKYYQWEGKRTGKGEMRITAEKANESLDIDLTFLTPWKSQSKVRFELKPKGSQTAVTWFMDGSLPFFMFFMKKMMEVFVGMDYERGLQLLKDYVEDGKVHSKLTMKGKGNYAGCQYVGIKNQCTISTLNEVMKTDFDKLSQWAQANGSLLAGAPFSMYHKWEFVSGKVQYTCGWPVIKLPDSLPAGFIKGSIPATETYTVVHTGPYRHLGNAWSLQSNLTRSKVYKINKKVHPFEVYVNMPGTVSDDELITEIVFATK